MAIEKSLIHKFLKPFDTVPFAVKYKDDEEFIIGEGTPEFKIIIRKLPSKAILLSSTSLALGEAYMNGDIDIEGDLYFALNILLSNIDKFTLDMKGLKKILHTSTSLKNQKEEVCSHYDIGNEFYKQWLDETMSYSCAYFKNETDTLYQAQMNKIHHILNKLNLKEGMTLLDIGCGWGYLLIEAAKKYKVHGLGITLSEEQYKSFKERIEKENLQDYLEVKLLDYRKLEDSGLEFDRVVSVGMLEHVGRENYKLFFDNVNAVLKPKGEFLLHYISSLKESAGDPWIKKYIFPGGVIPSIREIMDTSCEHKFYTVDVESLRLHYNKTLLCWYKNFEENIDEIRKLADEKFIRMWRIYLCSCAAGFNNGVVDLHQMLLTKGVNNELPQTREYMDKD
ncbi:MAG: cyclopropane-fatty-acyl-phospholipid synthase family protein [Clostridium sp.]